MCIMVMTLEVSTLSSFIYLLEESRTRLYNDSVRGVFDIVGHYFENYRIQYQIGV